MPNVKLHWDGFCYVTLNEKKWKMLKLFMYSSFCLRFKMFLNFTSFMIFISRDEAYLSIIYMFAQPKAPFYITIVKGIGHFWGIFIL